jgi:chromate transport protein ChrA
MGLRAAFPALAAFLLPAALLVLALGWHVRKGRAVPAATGAPEPTL